MPFRSASARYLWVVVLVAGCGEGAPPLDELPLRDALRADPEVVAALSDGARATLAARLEAARAHDDTADDVGDEARDAAALVGAVDLARVRRAGEPLIVGAVDAGVAKPVPDGAGAEDAPPLPPLEGSAADATADAERAALNGAAGDSVRTLLRASGASRLQRVTGWPTGAVAIGDSVYVNAAWLVALAPGAGDHADAGAGAAPTSGPSPATTAAAATTHAPAADAAPSNPDAGVAAEEQSALTVVPSTTGSPDAGTGAPPPPTSTSVSFWDACGAGCASSSCDDSSDDSCDTTNDGSSDSCNSTTDDGSADACNNVPDDGGNCQISRGGGGSHHRHHPATLAWLLAPLGFLMAKERR